MWAAWRTAVTGCATALALGSASADDVVIVNSLRPGITVKALVLPPAMATAKATVILLPGGDGWLAIAGGQPTRLTGNFLVRTRQGLHGMGFRTVLATAAAFNMMAASVDVSVAEINGGIANDPDPCQGGALHGFARAGAPALDALKK